MRLKPVIVWFLVLAVAFALGFFVMRIIIQGGNSKVQNQNAPSAPSKT